MDPRITLRLQAHGGVTSVTELLHLGVSRHVVDRAVAAGWLLRLRRNVVVDPQVWGAATPSERHALRARGTARAWRRVEFALSHHSALALAGLPVHGVDHRVHLSRLREGSGRSGTATRIHAAVPAAFVRQVDDVPVVAPGLACLQVAALFGVEAGLVSADALLRAAPGTDLVAASRAGRFCNGAHRAAMVVLLADGRSESPGESRSRWLLHGLGLPTPEPQAVIADVDGWAARVDLLFRAERVVVEFDGLLKYTHPDVLRAEKLREDRLRALGYEVVRLTWADLARPEAVKARILAAFARSHSRSA
jgi:hypothetical protein